MTTPLPVLFAVAAPVLAGLCPAVPAQDWFKAPLLLDGWSGRNRLAGDLDGDGDVDLVRFDDTTFRVLANDGPLEGVIGVKPGHILSPEEARRAPAMGDMYIDVGATSADEAASWGIEPGTPAVFVGELTPARNSQRCFGKCVDNRAGVVCVLEAAARLAEREEDGGGVRHSSARACLRCRRTPRGSSLRPCVRRRSRTAGSFRRAG